MSEPITTPGRILSAALYAALSPLVGEHDGIPAVYWLRAPGAGVASAILDRDLAGALAITARGDLLDAGFVGQAEVSGRVLLKAFAATDDAAQDLLAEAVAAIVAGLGGEAGYTVSARWAAEVLLPPLDGIFTAAALYLVTVGRAIP